MRYTWSKDLETGNALIDEQHKKLIAAINDLLDACASGGGRTKLNDTMKFLADYTAKHFGDEEKLQMQTKYPDYVNHKKLHDNFKVVVRDLGLQFQKEGPTIVLVGKVNASIGNWLLTHIKREDTKVAAHIHKSPR
jgi:hemerythrin